MNQNHQTGCLVHRHRKEKIKTEWLQVPDPGEICFLSKCQNFMKIYFSTLSLNFLKKNSSYICIPRHPLKFTRYFSYIFLAKIQKVTKHSVFISGQSLGRANNSALSHTKLYKRLKKILDQYFLGVSLLFLPL